MFTVCLKKIDKIKKLWPITVLISDFEMRPAQECSFILKLFNSNVLSIDIAKQILIIMFKIIDTKRFILWIS